MAASVILLVGLVGVLQGVIVAATQNSMANRRTRASVIANELLAAVELEGRSRLFDAAGLFSSSTCLPTYPTAVAKYRGDFTGVPEGLTGFSVCYIDVDATPGFNNLTPGYTTSERVIFKRIVAVYSHPSNAEISYVGVNVGWLELGQVRVVERFAALYSTTINQTSLEY